MSELTDFTLRTVSQQPWLVLLVGGLIVALAWWGYRRTTPAIAGLLRALLFSMRGMVILLITLLLLQPILGFTRVGERKPRLTVLIDRSQSMSRTEGGKSRGARLDSLLGSAAFQRVSSGSAVTREFFAGKNAPATGDLDTDRTAIGDALRAAIQREPKPDQILLLSDGRSNFGEEPGSVAEELPPVVAVDLAEEHASADLWIDRVEINPVGFLGQPTKVKIRLGMQGEQGVAAEDSIHLALFDGPTELGRLSLRADSASGQFLDGEISVTPRELGRRLWDVRVSPRPNEVTTLNNRQSVAVTILKSRQSILLVTARPDLELGFLRRLLRSQEKYDVTLLATGTKSGNLTRGAIPISEWTRFDAIILHDPTPGELGSYQQTLERLSSTRPLGVWVMLGNRFGAELMPMSVKNLLPASPVGARARMLLQEFVGEPAETQLFHPTVRIAEQRSEIRDHWQHLPPFELLIPCDSITPHATVTLSSSSEGQAVHPLIIIRRFGQGKLLQTNVAPLWRIDFARNQPGGTPNDYQRLVLGIVDWLTLPDEGDPIRLAPEHDLFSRGEPVRFHGMALDPGFRPLTGIGGRVVLTPADSSSGHEVEQPLAVAEDGSLRSQFASLGPGDYRYRAIIEQEGARLKEFTGRIRVEPFSREEYDQSGNAALLTSLAQRTGGNYLTPAQFDKLTEVIHSQPIKEQSRGEFTLWGKSWPLFLILGLLATEWVGRKLLNLL